MPAGKFFAYAAEILKLQPPHITDEPILAQMRRIGIERGKSFDIDLVAGQWRSFHLDVLSGATI